MLKYNFVILAVLMSYLPAQGWDDRITHPTLSEYAATTYANELTNGLFTANLLNASVTQNSTIQKGIWWIRLGARLEDTGDIWQFNSGMARSLNHFHNPSEQDLVKAGLNDLPFWISNGETALLWAQDGPRQLSKVGGDWTWQAVRQRYFNYLTASDNSAKDFFLADQLKGLGYQMHLIQDMSQPNHVRDDTHMLDGGGYRIGLETWAAKNDVDIIKMKILDKLPIPNITVDLTVASKADSLLTPIANLFDTRTYWVNKTPSTSLSQGLAEYTNANFFSEDTTFAAEGFSDGDKHYFDHPRKDETNLQTYIDNILNTAPVIDGEDLYERFIITKQNTSGEKLDCIAVPGFNSKKKLQEMGEHAAFYSSFQLDESCFEEYASKLIPLAVGYSKAMLAHFYRGTLEISPPDQQVYAITDGSKIPQLFKELAAKVQNTTSNELLKQGTTNGTLTAVASYKIDADYTPDLSSVPTHNTTAPFAYSVSKPVTITPDQFATINSEPTEFTFDFSGSPIPAGITDLTLQVVFQGTLGNENNIAVAVGKRDLSEPTHHVIFNNSDMFSLDFHLYTAETIRNTPSLALSAGPALLDQSSGPAAIDPFLATFDIGYSGDPNSTSFTPVAHADLPPGGHMRLVGIFDLAKANFLERAWSARGVEHFGNSAIQPLQNQDYGATWLSAPAAIAHREWLDTDGVTKRPFMQHYHMGVGSCQPLSSDANGNLSCFYPDQEAEPAAKAPVSVTIE
jgi:hypothetical protein